MNIFYQTNNKHSSNRIYMLDGERLLNIHEQFFLRGENLFKIGSLKKLKRRIQQHRCHYILSFPLYLRDGFLSLDLFI